MATDDERLAEFLARFTPEMEQLGATIVLRLRERLPQADALVFDNFNFLGVGFSSNGRSSGVFVSIVLYPRWANLFLFKGARMDDPAGLLEGDGKIICHVRIARLADFERPEIELLIAQAVALAEPPLDPEGRGRLSIASVAARQRPRRPD